MRTASTSWTPRQTGQHRRPPISITEAVHRPTVSITTRRRCQVAGSAKVAARLGDGWMGAGNDPDEIPGILDRLNALRREAGRDRLPFEMVVALSTPPDVDLFRRLEDRGVTSIVSWPLSYVVPPDATAADRLAALERYGEDVIVRAK